MLTPETLFGVWTPVLLPLDSGGNILEDDLCHDIIQLCRSGVHGLYTTGSAGEFYAISDKEFEWLIEVFADQTKAFAISTQIGASAFEIEGIYRRARMAARVRPGAIQVVLPSWMPLTDQECDYFFAKLVDVVDGAPIVHYNTARAKRFLTAGDYERILKFAPTLIGSKFVTWDLLRVMEVSAAGLPMSFFTASESILATVYFLGFRGVYSAESLMNPAPCLKLFELCQKGEWVAAHRLQQQFGRFVQEGEGPLECRGYSDAAWVKSRAEIGGYLRCRRYTRAPYRWVSEEDMAHLRTVASRVLPELLSAAAS